MLYRNEQMSKKLGFRKAFEIKLKNSQAAAKKKAISIFTAMSVAHVDDDQEPNKDSCEVIHVEKALPKGDFYTGQWYNGSPHGNGKYTWGDGCMYVGEWFEGKTMGKGKFSWPSGATYEGEFKHGFLDGEGTYTGFSGDVYKGYWVMNLKQGQGTLSYANGDRYEGEWSKGLQEGNGRYHWNNGNHYSGQWREGLMNGNGAMIWSNGNRFDGLWEDGFPKGNGSDNLDWDPQIVFMDYLKDCKICSSEEVSILPSDKMPDGPGMAKGTHVKLRTRSDISRVSSDVDFPMLKTPMKRQGTTISKGHKNYELMLNLQLGIRHSVGRPGPAISLDLKSSAFDPKEKVWTGFPPKGSKHTPPHQSCEFKWKDYCPVVFRTLRKLFDIDAADYMLSICGNDALRELSSPGKSGSFFYLTDDDKYMIKTVKKAEVKVLIRMLPAYYNHVRSFKDTLVTKFFGLHCVRLTRTSQKKVRFVVMGNLFCTDVVIHRRFDLKGSFQGRTTAKPEAEIDPTTTLKDLDLKYIFRLQKLWFQEFCRQVDRDCDFLANERIMDYSLLIGLHFRKVSTPCSSGARTPPGYGDSENGDAPRLSQASNDQHVIDSSWGSSVRLGINMAARAEKTVTKADCQLVGEPTGELYDVILFFGIIDILQDYDISKKLEHAYKSMQYDPTSISAVDPKLYSKRFRDFILKVFVQDT